MWKFNSLPSAILLAALFVVLIDVGAGRAGSDTGAMQNVTNCAALDSERSWRPAAIPDSLNGGGTGVIAYTYQPISGPEVHQIFTILLDGTENLKIIDAVIGLNHHEWSPDGGRFACVGYVDQWTWSIHTFDADGTNLTRLTTDFGVWDNEPSWSPDGSRIAWGRIYPDENYRTEVRMMNADGTEQHPVGVAGDGVGWSPDGTRLVYHDTFSGADIWTCNIDGTDAQQLTIEPSDDLMPDWSPCGTKIVFTSNRDGNYEIYVMDADGANPRRLTNNTVTDDGARWSPDGSLIAYSSGPHLAWEVYVMDSTGADIRRVTYSPTGITGINPDWEPIDTTSVPVYLTELFYTRDSASIRFAWGVSGTADPGDFRLLAGHGEGRRSVPVHATGPSSFEALDDHPSLRAGGDVVYHLLGLGDNGQWNLLRAETVRIEQPSTAARLLEVYPNPFNPETTISFAVSYPQIVRIDVHDAAGRNVRTLADGEYSAGDYRILWNGRDSGGRDVASGIYFLKFQAGKSKDSRKLVLVR